jgi:hypothetical protein
MAFKGKTPANVPAAELEVVGEEPRELPDAVEELDEDGRRLVVERPVRAPLAAVAKPQRGRVAERDEVLLDLCPGTPVNFTSI